MPTPIENVGQLATSKSLPFSGIRPSFASLNSHSAYDCAIKSGLVIRSFCLYTGSNFLLPNQVGKKKAFLQNCNFRLLQNILGTCLTGLISERCRGVSNRYLFCVSGKTRLRKFHKKDQINSFTILASHSKTKKKASDKAEIAMKSKNFTACRSLLLCDKLRWSVLSCFVVTTVRNFFFSWECRHNGYQYQWWCRGHLLPLQDG